MPKTEFVVNCSEVPLIVTLYKLAVPLKELVLVKVVVPADAVKLPVTASTDEMERFVAVVTVPVTVRLNKLMPPVAVMVLEVPLMVTLPALLVKLPAPPALKFPATVSTAVVEMVPLKVRSLNVNPVPVIVLEVPLMVNPPPLPWVNEPTPVAERLPATEIFTAPAVMLEPVKIRSLNASVPDPLMVVLAPAMVTVLVDTV